MYIRLPLLVLATALYFVLLCDERPIKVIVFDSVGMAFHTKFKYWKFPHFNTPEEAIAIMKDFKRNARGPPVWNLPPDSYSDRQITLPHNQTLGVRIFWPKDYKPDSPKKYPIFMWIHGGGWCLGDKDVSSQVLNDLRQKIDVIIVSVEYRLAPEHRFPAAVDDVFNHFKWLHQHASTINGDPNNIVVGGESAGGNLATVVAIKARDQKLPLRGQYLNVPVTNHNFNTTSYQKYKEGYFLSRQMMQAFFYSYAPQDAWNNQFISPLNAPSLKGLAPALVHTSTMDVLHDEGYSYYLALKKAENNVAIKEYVAVHGFLSFAELYPTEKDDALNELVKWLNKVYK